MTAASSIDGSGELDPYATVPAPLAGDLVSQPVEVQAEEIRVLGALLDEMPEAALLGRALPDTVRVVHEPSRLAVLPHVRSGHFVAVVFPVLDARGLPTAPLIQQCAVECSGTALLAICCSLPPRANALLAAARAGARVIVAPTEQELTALLGDLSRELAPGELVTARSLEGVEPPFLRDVLVVAIRTVGGNGRIGTLAALLDVSTRTLFRQLSRAGLPSPRALLAVARLLRACADLEALRDREAAADARAPGIAATRGLLRTARRYGVPVGGDADHPSLPRFGDALAAVVQTLGGRLAT